MTDEVPQFTAPSLEVSVPTVTATVFPMPDATPKDVALTAESPCALEQSQRSLLAWVKRKVELELQRLTELEKEADDQRSEIVRIGEFIEEARKHKWKISPLQSIQNDGRAKLVRFERRAKEQMERAEFYAKFQSALEHGYYVVPNFDVDIIAVRTDKKKPRRVFIANGRHGNDRPRITEESSNLPEGLGEYQNPFPAIKVEEWKGNPPEERFGFTVNGWREMEFPVTMARVEILESANRAMALKIFDEVGALPSGTARCGDPVMLGTIKCKLGSGYQRRESKLSFLITWHLDTRTLP